MSLVKADSSLFLALPVFVNSFSFQFWVTYNNSNFQVESEPIPSEIETKNAPIFPDIEAPEESGNYFENVVFETGKLSLEPGEENSDSEAYEEVQVMKNVPTYENVQFNSQKVR